MQGDAIAAARPAGGGGAASGGAPQAPQAQPPAGSEERVSTNPTFQQQVRWGRGAALRAVQAAGAVQSTEQRCFPCLRLPCRPRPGCSSPHRPRPPALPPYPHSPTRLPPSPRRARRRATWPCCAST